MARIIPRSLIYRRDIQIVYDKWEPAATIYVSSDGGVRGIAHCFPQVIRQEIRQASDANLAAIAAETTTQDMQLGVDELNGIQGRKFVGEPSI